MIAKAFETEYEIIGKTIHLHKVEYFKDNPLPLQYGKGKGFKTGVSRTTEQSRITRLYVQGGERNIDRSKYGNKELLLPKSQEYVYEGLAFVSDDKGLSIAIKDAQNNRFVNEQSLDLSHIYPKRKGKVSAVFEVNHDKHFYDFTDTSIPEALNFSDLQIKGEKMLIYFESGMLSGREFEVSKYDHAQNRFQLVPKEEDGTTMPNDIFKPAIGDEYSVYNMQMPNAYISDNATKSGASWEMMKEACKYLYENRADMFTFTGDLDGIWAKKRWASVGGRLKMGAYINFSDTEFQRTPVAIRIIGLKEYVNNPYSPQIELSNKVQGQSFATEIRKLQNQEVYFGELNKRTQLLTKRSWRDALETIKQVEEAFPEYTKSIIPATIQTMMALVGNKSGQFVFVANKTNPITVPHTLYFDRNNKQINAGSGWIKHHALGTTDIKPNYSAADYKYWYAPAFVSGRLDNKAKTYYLYIKASKVVETAEFVLSETKIDIEQEAGYYHFLYATVNSEYNGERGIAQLNGFTEITGGQIKTDKISSGNGEQYIHLFDDHIEIKARLNITAENKTEIKQLVNPDLLSLENKLKQYTNDQTSDIQIGGRNLLRETKDFSINASWQPYFMVKNWNGEGWTIVDEKFNGNVVRKVTGEWQGIKTEAPDIIGEPVTISFWAKTNVHAKFINSANNNKNTNNIKDFTEYSNSGVLISDNQWHRYTIYNPKGMCLGNGVSVGFLEFYQYIGEVLVSSIKIEKGNKATDWTPAPEDLEAQIQTEQQARTQAIITAKTSTEAYARTQSELTKAQAIAEANKQAGIAITAEQQARILHLQQNLQQAKAFAEQKVNELKVGGRNYFTNSSYIKANLFYCGAGITAIDKNSEKVSEFHVVNPNENWVRVYREPINIGELKDKVVTLSFDVKVLEGVLGSPSLYYTGTVGYMSFSPISGEFKLGEWVRVYCTFTMRDGWNEHLGWSHLNGKYQLRKFKLERGNKPTDWSPAPEDIENKVADIQTDLQNAINNAKALIAAEAQNIKNSNARIQNLENKTQIFSDTQIDGNVIATGTLIVGNTQGTKAGVSGTGLTNDSIRFWAGEPDKTKPIETPKEAEDRRRQSAFLVLQDGTLHATNAHISGQIEAKSGKIGKFNIEGGYFELSQDQHGQVLPNANAWTPNTNFCSISGNSILYRMNGSQRGVDYSEIGIGQTSPDQLGTRGAMQTIRSVQNTANYGQGQRNVALQLLAQGNNYQNIALNIVDGDIVIKGKNGYTGEIGIGSGYYLIVTNGILTNLIRK